MSTWVTVSWLKHAVTAAKRHEWRLLWELLHTDLFIPSRIAVHGAPSSCSNLISFSATRLSVSLLLPLKTVAYVPFGTGRDDRYQSSAWLPQVQIKLCYCVSWLSMRTLSPEKKSRSTLNTNSPLPPPVCPVLCRSPTSQIQSLTAGEKEQASLMRVASLLALTSLQTHDKSLWRPCSNRGGC